MKKNMTPKVDGSFYAIRKNVVGGFPFYVVSDDEYASLCAQNRGFVVVYVPEALVYAKDPNSFKAFIKWQQRITVGQMYIRKFFNYSVPTTKVSILFVISVKLIKKNWRNVLPILTLLSLVGISVIFAFKTFLQHKIPYVYN
jgi:cellulose synthase/poly-beta-1,6-N-acetylglucosamine synthase-like glycosyltransferase